MHVIACIRQVPDYEAPAGLFAVEGSPPAIVVSREVKPVIGLFDQHALEAALRLKDAHGATVTAVTLGPPGAVDVLKRALHMGADAAVLIDEQPYGELDAAATATVLAAAITKLAPFDMVLCGRQASDWDGGVVGAGVAECLDLPLAVIAAVAEVEVDTSTGQVNVTRVVVAHDCGLIINPEGIKMQIDGNVIQGISRTLLEEVKFDASGVKSRDWVSYPVARFQHVPKIEYVLINRPDLPFDGAAESAVIAIPAAIGNAVFDATGVRLREVPFTRERVLNALKNRESAARRT